jgi:hypothetical protein
MEALIIIAVLGLVGGGSSVYYERKRESKDYADYMARRIAFSVSVTNNEE